MCSSEPQLILGSWLTMVGALVRVCGTLAGETSTLRYAVVMSGQTFGALGQLFIVFTPTKVAAHWFPDHQRATANMAASMCEFRTRLIGTRTLLEQHFSTLRFPFLKTLSNSADASVTQLLHPVTTFNCLSPLLICPWSNKEVNRALVHMRYI